MQAADHQVTGPRRIAQRQWLGDLRVDGFRAVVTLAVAVLGIPGPIRRCAVDGSFSVTLPNPKKLGKPYVSDVGVPPALGRSMRACGRLFLTDGLTTATSAPSSARHPGTCAGPQGSSDCHPPHRI
eukprot:1191122-Prorocentrum_minimum.AAC.4